MTGLPDPGPFYRAYLAVLALKAGVEPEAVLALAPAANQHKSEEGRAAATIRARALYLTVTEHNIPLSAVARAAGVSKQAVSKALRRVEDWRDDGRLDRELDQVGALISGNER